MDYQRVTALVEAIDALPSEEQSLLRQMLATRSVESTPGICGSYARLKGTRIPIWTLVSLRNQGADHAELLRNYPTLTLEKLQVAWDYYDRHREETDRIIASHDEA
ncbi:MAG: DUF433 domain-containing protein [Alkalinema sp. RU_4_3]|nr:DUF433 domain-containing protein [Alkalinema sp. RU_4_3]